MKPHALSGAHPVSKLPPLFLLPALLLVLPLGGCTEKAGATSRPAETKARTVRIAPVGVGELVDTVELIGELQGFEEMRVVAQVPERIRSVTVKEGQQVKQGEVLATLAGEMQSEGYNQAQAGLEAALAGRDAVQDNLKRSRALAKAGSIPQSQLEALETQARSSDAQVRQATAGVALASTQRSRTLVRSPITGVVAQLTARAGDLANPGMPLMTIIRADRLKAVLRVPERDFLRVAEGMKVMISPLARPDLQASSTVTVRGPMVDRMTRTGLIEVHLDNADGKLLAGSAIRAVIEISRKSGVVLVPASAVLMTAESELSGKALAFVAEGKTARKMDITLGARQGGQIEVVDGITEGQQLIVQGASFLRDGNPITIAADRAGGTR